jgi:phage/plasmid primase-like uncharacterized protein
LYAAVSKITGKNWTPPKPPSKEEEVAAHAKKQAWAFKVWDASVPIVGTPGATYLASRCLPHLVNSKALRFNAEVSHPQRGKLPAIVALVVNVTGEPIAVHRTYLAPNGHGKAAVSPQKASLGPVSGGTIRLNALKPHTPLVIGEGLETSASAGLMMGAPAWAAISAGNMARNLALPPEVTEVIIAVDPDAPGRRAARRAGQRWRSEGRYVSFAYPPGTGDFNDLLCARKKEADHG